MDKLNSSNRTLGPRWRLAVLASLVWAIGGTLDGKGLWSLIAVPLLVGAWICAVFVVDRWVGVQDPAKELSGHMRRPRQRSRRQGTEIAPGP